MNTSNAPSAGRGTTKHTPSLGKAIIGGLLLTVALATGQLATHHHSERPNDHFPRPIQNLTPGEIDPSLTQDYLCSHTTDDRRNTTQTTKNQVYRRYALPAKNDPEYKAGTYEIDHRVPLWAGGRDIVTNLWPEPNDHPPGALNSKDILERTLYDDVCHKHTVSLLDAQHAFLGDWVQAYQHYVGSPVP